MKSVRLLVLAAGTVLLLLLQSARDSLAGAAMLSEVAAAQAGASLGAPLLGESVRAGDGSAAALLVLPKDSAPGPDSSEVQPKAHPLSLGSLLMPRARTRARAREKLVYARHQHRTDTDEELELEADDEEDQGEENGDEGEQEQDPRTTNNADAADEDDDIDTDNDEDDEDDEDGGEPEETVTRDEMVVDSNESRFSFYSRPTHGGHGGPGSKGTPPEANPCDSSILEYLRASEQVVPVRRSPEEEDTNFYIDVRHDALETRTGIVPGIEYTVEVRRSPDADIRDFYIESLVGEPPHHGTSSRPEAAPTPFGKFATDGSEFRGRTPLGHPHRQPPAADTLDSIPRSTWIDDMEKDWLHRTYATRQQQQQRQPLLTDVVGQRVVFGEPFPAYFEPAADSQREHDTEEDEGEQNSIEFDELDDAGRRRRPASSRANGRVSHRCPGNVWQQEFMFEDRATSRWTVPRRTSVYRSALANSNRSSSSEEIQQRQSQTVYLRILYRTMTSYVVYELIYTMVLLEECSLFLKQAQGSLTSNQLPGDFLDCSVTFPSRPANQPDELPGLLVQLTRLNTPCRAGGFLRFVPDARQRDVEAADRDDNSHQTISLCGKLEELPAAERAFHFQPHRNTTLHLHNQPLFGLQYRLVDFCYNATLQAQNGTVRLRPGRTALDCYFKVHVPFGYRVAMHLWTNDWQLTGLGLGLATLNGSTVHHEPIELDALPPVPASQRLDEPVRCSSAGGMLVELYEDSQRRWTSCVNGSTVPARYSLVSRNNNLVIKVTKQPPLATRAEMPREGWPASSSSSPSPSSTAPSASSSPSIASGNAGPSNGSSPSPSPSLLFEYRAHPIEPITSRCAFGWIATAQFCIASIERRLPWQEAEADCNRLGGHLASIRSSDDQQLIDQLLFNSPGYKDDNAYWIGASDLVMEGDFRWNDKFSFSYTNWFQGWVHQEHYNRQPNDDGLSGQDCVEIRRHFQIASGSGQTAPTMSPLTTSYMWNDRNCDAPNYYVCERMMDEELPERLWNEAECNVTVTLSAERSKATIWSPGFPQLYPDSVDCYTLVLAPVGYRVVLDFEEMVLENEPLCSYDYLQLVEPDGSGPYVPSKMARDFSSTVLFRFRNSRHSNRNSGVQHRRKGSRPGATTALPSRGGTDPATDGTGDPDRTRHDISFSVPSIVLQPNDSRYTSSLPLPERSLGSVPRRICGDWSTKLKLLRYVTAGPTLGLRFVSDYSNSYGGYKAKISMENVTSECHDERFKAYNNSCYLIISYPDVDWTTAQQICRGIGAQLASISTTEEQRFITSNIRNSVDYTPRSLYWVGGEITANGNLEWVDGVKLLFEGWLPGQRPEPSDTMKLPSCLGLQWKVSPTPMISSGLHWTAQRCSVTGGYVCKKPRPKLDETMVKNQTLTGTEGHILSPGYPNPYPAQTDFWIRIVAPEHNRIIVQFQKLDLEHQDECLYDYISIQNYPIVPSSPVAFYGASEAGSATPLGELYRAPNGTTGGDSKPASKSPFLSASSAQPADAGGRQTRGQNRPARRRIRYVSSGGAEYGITEQDGVAREAATGGMPAGVLLADGRVQPDEDELHPTFLPYVRWCGSHDVNMARFNFISAGNEAIVRFHSDFSISGAGFSATWSTVDIAGCPLQTITSKEGSIRSPNYPYFLLNDLDCTYVIQAPYGRRVWLEFLYTDLAHDAALLLDIADGPFEPFADESHVNDGVFVSNGERLVVRLRTGANPRGKGFQAVFKTLAHVNEQRYIVLSNRTTGMLYSLNYPQPMPYDIDYTQHLIAPLGEVILLELYGVGFSPHGCHQTGFIEIYDNYTDSNGTLWHLCEHQHAAGKLANIAGGSDPEGGTREAYQAHGLMGPLRDMAPSGLSRPGTLSKPAPIYITSYLNTIHIRQRNVNGSGIRLNATVRLQEDAGYKMKLIANADEWVESCKPNPCQYGGKCIASHQRGLCQCYGHFTGRFCGLNICELEPCFFGKCELTPSSFKCNCQPGFVGQRCDQRQKPCAENPCESRGECFEKNGGFFCRCHAWWEGPRCEKRMMHIPYKPLSERMLQEPFWLGLITVFVVLAVIGLVWCAKRHFPEKIEKLLADETQINRTTFPPHHLNTALREQLQASAGTVPSSNATTPASHRTIFGRLGIRKPSILSLSSPQQVGGATARTFSLDDLLRPPPRRTPSPRKKRNNSTPTKKNVNEKKQILQQLVSPAQNAATKQVSLGELIQLSETRIKAQGYATGDADASQKETTFSENSLSVNSMVRQISDPKLEKKVTFARLLSKVSAEMSSGSEDLANGAKHSSALSLPNEVPPRANSVPPSPCTNEIRSPHSTSSNQGSDSLSSSELALHDFGLRSGGARRQRPKVSSADSILAMFKNFAASSSALHTLPSSIVISPSSTPTASSPQDDVPGDDDSSTSSNHTPVSYSSGGGGGGGASDSPVFYRQSTIEVPVLDALSAHKSSAGAGLGAGAAGGAGGGGGGAGGGVGGGGGGGVGGGVGGGSGGSGGGPGQLHPTPTILLEIPSNGINNKCLSPIREMPTPIPSPALTPIMPRPQRSGRTAQSLHDESMSVTFNTSFDDYHKPHQLSIEIRPPSPPDDGSSSQSDTTLDGSNGAGCFAGPTVSIDVHPPTPEHRSPERPRDLIIPELIIQQPSPTRERTMVVIFPGSPPPHRANESFDAGLLPCAASSSSSSSSSSSGSTGGKQQQQQQQQQQKRFLKQWEKPTSLDLPFDLPMITITANSSEVVSDADVLSPALPMGHAKPHGAGGLGPAGGGGAAGMCYLSPFSMCIRGDRAPSESNLSSSGYSSMASPGPSRCGSSNPLFPHESDEPGSGSAGPGGYAGFHSLLNNRRQSASGGVRKKSADGGAAGGGGGSSAAGATTGFGHHHHQHHHHHHHHQHSFRLRSDSETLSDEPLLESNDEGIGTDHLDEKIEEGEIRSAKELELYLGKELIQSGQDILTGQESLSMSQLQLPSIVIQADAGCDKLSPVSSRSDSPLSERNASLERFSSMFYGKKDQHLPFTDSDGLYDFPSSDGKGAGGTVASSHRKTAGRRKDRRVARSAAASLQSPSRSTALLLELPAGKEGGQHVSYGVGKFPSTAPTARKSPKRRIHRQPLASSSSSTESLTSMRENATRQLKDPSGAALLSASKAPLDVGDYGDDTGEEISSQILPKGAAAAGGGAGVTEEVRKPSHKIRRLKAIGNQIRFLRRIERSIHRKEQPAAQQPPDEDTQCSSGGSGCATDSPKMSSSPLIKYKQSQIDEEDESEEDDEHGKRKYFSSAPNKHQQQQHQRLLPACEVSVPPLGTGSRQHGKISRQRRVLSHDCYGAKPWAAEAECKLLGGEVNSD